MKIRLILGLLAALMLVEPVAAVAAPANGIVAGGYARLATPLVSDEGSTAKVEKAWWRRRFFFRRYGWYRPYRRFWYRPYYRRYGWYRPYRRFWYRPFVYRRVFWRRRFFY